jgi:hypothetical protein
VCVWRIALAGVLAGFLALVGPAAVGAAGSGTTVVPSGKVAVYYDFQTTLPVLPVPADARINGYGFAGRVTGDECAGVIGNPGAQFEGPQGDQVCMFSLSLSAFAEGGSTTSGQSIPAFAGTIHAGDDVVALTTDQLEDAADGVDFAVAVPDGATVTLDISSGGYSQSYSLSAARPVGIRPTALYLSSSWHETLAANATANSVASAVAGSATVMTTVTGLTESYFLPTDPLVTAPSPDDAFLQLTLRSGVSPGSGGTQFGAAGPIPLGSVVLRLPSGATVRGQTDDSTSGLVYSDYAFVVPATVGSAELTVDYGTQQMDNTSPGVGPGTTAEVRIAPVAFEIVLPDGQSTPGVTVVASPAVAKSGAASSFPTAAVAGGAGGLVVVVIPVVLFWRRRRDRKEPGAVADSPPVESQALLLGEPLTEEPEETGEVVAEGGDVAEALTQESPEHLVLNCMGTLEVKGLGEESLRSVLLELALYLALQEGKPVSSDKLRSIIGDAKSQTLRSRITELRALVGEEVLPDARSGGYRFVGEIDCDWLRFNDFVSRAERARRGERETILFEALKLVRGVPFAEAPEGRYLWAIDEGLAREMANLIEQVAHDLAADLLGGRRQGEAEWVASAGLRAAPYSDGLHVDRLRATEHSPARFRVAWAEAKSRLGEDWLRLHFGEPDLKLAGSTPASTDLDGHGGDDEDGTSPGTSPNT